MAVIDEVVACILVGAVSVVLGIWQIKTKETKYIHPKYLRYVDSKDREKLAFGVGVGITTSGLGCIVLAPALLYRSYKFGLWGIVFLFAGLLISLLTIGVFNGRYD